MKNAVLALGTLAVLLLVTRAEATLIATSADLVCDNVSNLCWNRVADLSGQNDWQGQVDWADNLVLGGFDDFRLATIGELENLYDQLVALGGCSGSDCRGSQGPFTNIRYSYWSGTEVGANLAWRLRFDNGVPLSVTKTNELWGWAVRPVPEPGSLVLMGLGLVMLPMARRWWAKA